MKRFLAILAFTTLIGTGGASASYLLAPNSSPEQREQYEWYHTAINQYHTAHASSAAQSRVRGQVMREYGPADATRTRSTNPAHDVYVGGEYMGSDPDPRIQDALRREGRWW